MWASITIVSEARALALITKTGVASPSPNEPLPVLAIREGISVHQSLKADRKPLLGSLPHPKNAAMFQASAKSLVCPHQEAGLKCLNDSKGQGWGSCLQLFYFKFLFSAYMSHTES